MRFSSLPASLPLLLLSATATLAHAEDPAPAPHLIGEERRAPLPGIEIQSDHVSKILYLNRCEKGCTITPGSNDARYNTSSIVGEPSQISPWRHGDEAWEELVQCVKEIYAPYDVEITDEDPGDNIFHHEAIVAGRYTDIGYDRPVGGVAPSQCFPANNVISFTFANGYSSPISICHTVGQETAHSYGLEHAMDCSDPMTYLPTCGRQFFRDATTPCGEFQMQPCQCGGSAQNSHRWLTTVLGASEKPQTLPTVAISSPEDGEQVQNGFSIFGSAGHMRGVSKVEFLLNGTVFEEKENPNQQVSFTVPSSLADGIIDVEIRATNDIGVQSSSSVTVQKGEPCTSADQCSTGQECEDGRCLFPAPTGKLGDACLSDFECETGLCPKQGDTRVCSKSCFPTATENTCPDNFECVDLGGNSGICWPVENAGCGCQSSSSGGAGSFALFALVWVALRRRNQNPT